MSQALFWILLIVIAIEIVFMAVVSPTYLPAWFGAVGSLSYSCALWRSSR